MRRKTDQWAQETLERVAERLKQLPPDRQDAFQKDVLRADGPALFMLDTHVAWAEKHGGF